MEYGLFASKRKSQKDNTQIISTLAKWLKIRIFEALWRVLLDGAKNKRPFVK